MADTLLQLMLVPLLLIAAATDIRFGKIPNWLIMGGMAIGFFGHASISGISGMLFSLKGLGSGLALFLGLYLIGGMGAGDVKLLAAVGSFIGAEGIVSAGIMAMLLGGLYAMAMMIAHGGMRASLKEIATMLKSCILMPGALEAFKPAKAQPQLRYALVIGLGTLMSQWMQTAFFSF
jgi:prepilin peptidase CpaA